MAILYHKSTNKTHHKLLNHKGEKLKLTLELFWTKDTIGQRPEQTMEYL